MTEDLRDLLNRFTRDRSEAAFRDLVRLQSPLVYGTALRLLQGNRAAAQDVMQEVFTLLARKAPRLDAALLTGWLYRQTCRRASNHRRSENRRKIREMAAVEIMSSSPPPSHPLGGELDEALNALSPPDRNALLLRFFQNHDFRQVGGALGISEEAARKRVQRAMDKLVAALRRRGITAGAAALGTTMKGMGSTPVPEAVVSRVSTEALRSLPAAAGGIALSLATPFVLGALATSVVAVAANQRPPAIAPPSLASVEGIPHAQDLFPPLPRSGSLADIIAEIQRVEAGPENSLTGLRLRVVLSRISNERIPAFVQLADERLSMPEKVSVYTSLLEGWVDADPAAALAFSMGADIAGKIDSFSGTHLLPNLFDRWLGKHRREAMQWLLENFDDPALSRSALHGEARHWMTKDAVELLALGGDPDDLTGFVNRLPGAEAQREALDALGGNAPWHRSFFLNADRSRAFGIYQALHRLADPAVRHGALVNYLRSFAENRLDDFAELKRSSDARDRYLIAIAELGTRQVRTSMTPLISGRFIGQAKPVENREPLEAAAMQAGIEAGVPRQEILSEMGRILVGMPAHQDALAWLERNLGVTGLDDTLAASARKDAAMNGHVGGERYEMIGILKASHISDPELRLRLCRGAFRQLVSRNAEAAETAAGDPRLPQDLVREFQALLKGGTP